MPINSRLGKKMTIDVERVGINGEGVGNWYGCTIFVDGALPGEQVQASLYEKRKNYGRAYVQNFLTLSPDRQDPICPLFGKCGGCQLMHLKYQKQLKIKRQRVVDALERIAKIKGVNVADCLGSEPSLHYRNKIQIPIAPSDQGMRFGLYARNTHDLVEMKECYIHCSLGEEVYKAVLKILQSSSMQPYDFKSQQGELRHLLIKTAVGTNEVLVVIVSAKKPSTEITNAANAILSSIPLVKGVVHNYNPDPDNTVLGSVYTTLAGQDAIEDILCSLKVKVSPASFFQVNPAQAEKLYQQAISASNVGSNDTVLDAYCGVGVMSLLFARKAKKVIGVEIVDEAIKDAKINAEKNQIVNASFFAAPFEKFLEEFSEKINITVLNPPRKGCDPFVIDKVADLTGKKIVYVSCDPATLARDLQLLISKGWKIDLVQPFDMFPQTSHVETLVTLSK